MHSHSRHCQRNNLNLRLASNFTQKLQDTQPAETDKNVLRKESRRVLRAQIGSRFLHHRSILGLIQRRYATANYIHTKAAHNPKTYVPRQPGRSNSGVCSNRQLTLLNMQCFKRTFQTWPEIRLSRKANRHKPAEKILVQTLAVNGQNTLLFTNAQSPMALLPPAPIVPS